MNGDSFSKMKMILGLLKSIYKYLRPWLVEQSQKTDTPIDDWMIQILDKILGD